MSPSAASGTEEVPGSATQIRSLVAQHSPADPLEAEAKARMVAELQRLERPCDEDADPVHVTASAVIVGPRGTLLHRHRRLGRWMQPGGHIDPGESPWEAALRESEEETGLPLAHPDQGPLLLRVDAHEAAFGHTHLDLEYLLIGPDREPDPPPHESQDVRWFTWEEAMQMVDASLAGALAAGRRAYRTSDARLGAEGNEAQ